MTAILGDVPMRPRQIGAITLCVALNALDGFDVLSIGFASPGIAAEWRVDRAALGLVLSMELIGMAVGSVVLGRAADRFGRRPAILFCIIVMACGMFLATRATGVVDLSGYRLFTGLGIGGMLAATNAMVAELASTRRRNLCVAVMAAGYPMGAVAGGTVASLLLAEGGWRDVFLFGALATAALLPLALWLLPESPDWQAHTRRPDALARINTVLTRFGHAALARLPDAPPVAATGFAALFEGRLARLTVLLTLGYFAHVMTFYFILKWTPKIVADMGFAASSAGGVLVAASFGGMTGALLLSALTLRFPVRRLVVAAMLGGAALVAVFGQSPPDLAHLAVVAALAGAFTNAAIVGLYAVAAAAYPPALRAGGTGFVIGIGRGGAALGPILAGQMFAGGWALPEVALAMAAGSLVAAAALIALGSEARG